MINSEMSIKMVGKSLARGALILAFFAGQAIADTISYSVNYVVTSSKDVCIGPICNLVPLPDGTTFQKTFTLNTNQLVAGSYDVSGSLLPMFVPQGPPVFTSTSLTANAIVSGNAVTDLSIAYQSEYSFAGQIFLSEFFNASAGEWSDVFSDASPVGSEESTSAGTYTVSQLAAPEPGTKGILLTGGIAIVIFRRKRLA
jgi:hypothetical protein